MRKPYAGLAKETEDPLWDTQKTKDEAIEILKSRGWSVRMCHRDGATFLIGSSSCCPTLTIWCEKSGKKFDPPLLEMFPGQDYEDLKRIRWNSLPSPEAYQKGRQ